MVKQKLSRKSPQKARVLFYAESSRLKVQHSQPRHGTVPTVRSVADTQRAIAAWVPHKVEFQQVR